MAASARSLWDLSGAPASASNARLLRDLIAYSVGSLLTAGLIIPLALGSMARHLLGADGWPQDDPRHQRLRTTFRRLLALRLLWFAAWLIPLIVVVATDQGSQPPPAFVPVIGLAVLWVLLLPGIELGTLFHCVLSELAPGRIAHDARWSWLARKSGLAYGLGFLFVYGLSFPSLIRDAWVDAVRRVRIDGRPLGYERRVGTWLVAFATCWGYLICGAGIGRVYFLTRRLMTNTTLPVGLQS